VKKGNCKSSCLRVNLSLSLRKLAVQYKLKRNVLKDRRNCSEDGSEWKQTEGYFVEGGRRTGILG
jgi:hypothetical protein